jgi:sortase (surface protein transpeptidase)
MQVPSTSTVAGWFTGSPRPGAVGSSIIVGHVDSKTGPGIFYRLPELKRGVDIYIKRSDGTTAEFRVTEVQEYPKDQFPTETVYGPTPDAELRLITCGGTFDSVTGHYLSNIIVYASQIR